MPLKTHVAAPGSTNSDRLTARPAREDFLLICACTESIGAGIGAVCVERGRPTWPITMLTDANQRRNTQKIKKDPSRLAWPVVKSLLFSLGNQEKKASRAS